MALLIGKGMYLRKRAVQKDHIESRYQTLWIVPHNKIDSNSISESQLYNQISHTTFSILATHLSNVQPMLALHMQSHDDPRSNLPSYKNCTVVNHLCFETCIQALQFSFQFTTTWKQKRPQKIFHTEVPTKYLLIKFQKHKYGKKGKNLKASSLGLYSLDCSRLRGDLIEVYKIDKLTAQAILPKLGEIGNQKTQV